MCRKRAIFSSFTASSSANTPKTSVRRNASGSISERSTCDSAAKLTTASTPRMTSRTTFASQTSPCTNVYRESFARSDRKSTRPNSSHLVISYAVFCLKKKKKKKTISTFTKKKKQQKPKKTS